MSETFNRHWSAPARSAAFALGLAAAACGNSEGNGPGGAHGPGPGQDPGPGPMIETGVDPGRVEIHRLNNAEYNNTVRDLLGTTLLPASNFLAEEGLAFDNTANALGMTAPQYEAYFNAARDLMAETAATPAQLARIMTCTPSAPTAPCARQILEKFGFQVYRRPLEVTEIDRAMKVYDAEFARSKSGSEAITLAVRGMLSAANFLYRIEYDANPTSATPHSLSAYELASRLSYLTYSSMPDAALFDAATKGDLFKDASLEAQVDRLLADPKAAAFIESFGGQWLDIRNLITHSVVPQIFPTYTPQLSDAMAVEGYLWFQELVNQDHPLSDFFTSDFNYVNDVLAQHYGMTPPGSGSEFKRVTVTTDQRRGFLGLASFLTRTSFPSRTSPTLRGVWVLSELLCSPPPPPPNDVPKLDEATTPEETGQMPGTENVRERLERHRTGAACKACHAQLDPIGLGLERYDGIGRYRETYGNGDPIDPAGVLPDGTPFAGPDQLGDLVSKDPRFSACAASKLFTYALGREVTMVDAPALQQIESLWTTRGPTIRNLMKEVVLSSAFRFRRGETP